MAVLREELTHRSTYVQQGRYFDSTKVSDEPVASKGPLQVPVSPDNVLLLAAEVTDPLAGVAVSAKLTDEGKSCVMTLHGTDIRQLPASLGAKLTIAVRE